MYIVSRYIVLPETRIYITQIWVITICVALDHNTVIFQRIIFFHKWPFLVWDDPLKIGARDLISHRLSANRIASLFFKTNHRKITKIIFSWKMTIWKLFNPLIALLGKTFTFISIFFNPLAARFKFQTTFCTPQYIDVVNCWRFWARKSTVQRLIGNDVGTVHANNLNVSVFLYSDSWLIGG